MKTFKATWIILLGAILAMSIPVYAQPEEAPFVKLLNEMTEKPEHHLAIAVYYRTLASEARAEVEKHEAMTNTYRHDHQRFKAGRGTGQSMSKHCDRLIQLYQSTAEEYEALAALHEAEAENE
tara:strand:+ start:14026 stop:14394 length:369 start_codon:yes stop_codon:yes gene_type:complete